MSVAIWFRFILQCALLILLSWLLVACGDSGEYGDAADTTLEVSWPPNPESISGHLVYYGPTEDTATTVASDLPVTSSNFNPQAPSVKYNAALDLGLNSGSNVCFRIRAYNNSGLSEWSKTACGAI